MSERRNNRIIDENTLRISVVLHQPAGIEFRTYDTAVYTGRTTQWNESFMFTCNHW
jgi:histidine ammonia-lyase (EC 4.3.1.3)